MAITAVERVIHDFPEIVIAFQCSTIDAGQDVNLTHTQPKLKPYDVRFVVKTRPTDGSDVRMEWDAANDSATSKTIRVRFDTNGGGSLTGAVVDVFCHFHGAAAGGISAA